MIIELLNDSVMKFKHSMEILNELTKDLSEKENIILQKIFLKSSVVLRTITAMDLRALLTPLLYKTPQDHSK